MVVGAPIHWKDTHVILEKVTIVWTCLPSFLLTAWPALGQARPLHIWYALLRRWQHALLPSFTYSSSTRTSLEAADFRLNHSKFLHFDIDTMGRIDMSQIKQSLLCILMLECTRVPTLATSSAAGTKNNYQTTPIGMAGRHNEVCASLRLDQRRRPLLGRLLLRRPLLRLSSPHSFAALSSTGSSPVLH